MTLTEWMGIASTVGLGTLGWLKFRQSQKVDAITAQSGAASDHRAGTQQVIEGLNSLIGQYRETVEDDREVIALLEGRIGAVTALHDACKAENARLRKKYGVNGD